MLPAAIRDRRSSPHGADLYLAERELPFFAEYAAFCWGRVDYESGGDCARPCDRAWGWLDLRVRGGEDRVLVFRPETCEPAPPANFPHPVRVEATDARLAWLAAYLTMRRTPALAFLRRRGHMVGYGALADQMLAGEDADARWERARAVRAQFESDALRPFDAMAWWGAWKWEGDYASAGAWPRRQLLHAVNANDRTALPHLFETFGRGVPEPERAGWMHGLGTLTGKSFATADEWLQWWERIRRER